MQGTKLHNRGVEQTGMLPVQQLLCQLAEVLLALRGIKSNLAIKDTR